MSTSLLYHVLNIVGYRYRSTEYVGKEIIFTVEQDPSTLRCSRCGSRKITKRGASWRRFLAPGFAFKRIVIRLSVQRVECHVCNVVRQVKVGFAEENRRYIRQFERCALDLSAHMTIQDVAHHFGVSWDVVKDIQKRYLKRRFSCPRLKGLRKIAIDEIYVGKKRKFLTIVLDLETGAVVFVGEGKSAAALEPFWKRLKSAKKRIDAVAIDMSKAYIQAVTTNLPNAVLVFDHFHVIKLFNEKLTDLRRKLYREMTDLLHKDVLKGIRWLLLKNPENLNDKRNERQRLEEALRLNQPLACAYYLKEDLRQIWNQPNRATAQAVLEDWIRRAEASGVQMLEKFAKTLASYRSGILAYYDFRISTGPLEATNNKIKTLQRQAYGFRDPVFFTLKIYAIHLSTYALVG
jgi:transposase